MLRLKLFFPLIFAFSLIYSAMATAQQTERRVDVLPGSEIQGGIGHFGDPTVLHGITVSLQAGFGASNRTNTFGFDTLTVSGRWTPGTSDLAKT